MEFIRNHQKVFRVIMIVIILALILTTFLPYMTLL